MLRIIFGFMLLFALTNDYAQSKKLEPLDVGDQLPEVFLSKASYYSNAKYQHNGAKPKLTILDFWGVFCTACIKEMPEMQEYQNELGDKVQVYLITSDHKKDLDALSKKSKYFRDVALPIIFDDTALIRLFPSTAYGLHVWVDSNNNVVKRTSALDYSLTDIKNFLAEREVKIVERNDKTGFNRKEWIASEGNGRQQKNVQVYSILSSRISDYAGSGSFSERDSVSHEIKSLRMFNVTIPNLLFEAYSEGGSTRIYKTFYRIKDSSRYFPAAGQLVNPWRSEHEYCYELRLPPQKAGHLFQYMRLDLKRFFGVRAKIKRRRIPVVELCRTKDALGVQTKGGPRIWIDLNYGDSLILKNADMESFVETIGYLVELPAFDYSGIKTNIDISLADPHNNINQLNKGLKPYGLRLRIRIKNLPVLVAYDEN